MTSTQTDRPGRDIDQRHTEAFGGAAEIQSCKDTTCGHSSSKVKSLSHKQSVLFLAVRLLLLLVEIYWFNPDVLSKHKHQC